MSRKNKKQGINLVGLFLIIIIVILVILGIIKSVKQLNNDENETIQPQLQEEVENEKYVKILGDSTKLNISPTLNANKNFNGLLIKDIQLTYKDGVTNILAKVENTTSEKKKMTEIEIELIDENSDTIYKLQGIIEDIEPKGETMLNSSITADFSNAYDFKISNR